ncbi:MAG: hypothetical protein R2788_12585 [Saprospiraceae bacterium]
MKDGIAAIYEIFFSAWAKAAAEIKEKSKNVRNLGFITFFFLIAGIYSFI